MITLAVFGLAWWMVGTSVVTGPLATVAVVLGLAATVGVLLPARRTMAHGAPPSPPDAGVMRRFGWINIAQGAAIAATVAVCVACGVPSWIPVLVVFIVGAHFLPLATLFQQPEYRVTAALLIAAGGIAGVVGAAGGPPTVVRAIACIPTALALWGSAVWLLSRRTNAR
ncbi:DUF7010 family protein [Streptomyces reniochalinae]|uniref:Uncharacterized protein n=1 Tax=Streptomyces reniochalinae TaxID=2250578 RepID=A0A367E7E5_9ACTN|nr:hypothetical protein [Streptomyces reniochalinae]RCG13679.1 hypothetical protein DQ392_31740 [Streptomyces reniochalinae]